MRNLHFIIVAIALIVCSCGGDVIPKPQGFLSLEYPAPIYEKIASACDYSFEKNNLGTVRFKDDCSAVIDYPKLDASLFITYRKVTGNIETLLRDAQKLTYEHVRKADNIAEEKYINDQQNAYGMFYDVLGNAASQSQFYVTDSTNHFLTGSIYFNVKPNYDSIYPAAVYLKNDIRRLMETVEWEE
ncbi:gliding motility lipoprotein GldD [Dokdonia sinensis]|uniref:Gliding motility lipoprotein GldD n=1 Tax=Dokdonia sinensis TaxID=2479847 RepID=A0A3M0GGH6_9FLAO|nr:gliding motility lipoprotein GldD [Dokdonia sinensis]RMB56426.1 gliding motility lipoprotein GldD [Dokdonia sinensis]